MSEQRYQELDSIFKKFIQIKIDNFREIIKLKFAYFLYCKSFVRTIVLSPFMDLDKFFNIEIGKSFIDFFERFEKGIDWFI